MRASTVISVPTFASFNHSIDYTYILQLKSLNISNTHDVIKLNMLFKIKCLRNI